MLKYAYSIVSFSYVLLDVLHALKHHLQSRHLLKLFPMQDTSSLPFLIKKSNDIVVEGLGGGIEIVGGLWMFFLCADTVKSGGLPKGLSVLGLIIGAAGILTIYPADILTEIFGIGQIVWFIWLGTFMLRNTKS